MLWVQIPPIWGHVRERYVSASVSAFEPGGLPWPGEPSKINSSLKLFIIKNINYGKYLHYKCILFIFYIWNVYHMSKNLHCKCVPLIFFTWNVYHKMSIFEKIIKNEYLRK